MANTPRLISVEALFDWFVDNNLTYWVLYKGHIDRRNRSNAIMVNDEDISLDDSWEKLKRNIENQATTGGKFTIQASAKKAGNYGPHTFLELPNTNVQVAGTQSTPTVQGGPFMPNGVGAYLDEKMNTFMEKVTLQQENKELKEYIEYLEDKPSENWKEEIYKNIAKDPMAIVQQCIGVIGMLKNSSTSLAVAGHSDPVPKPDSENSESALTPEEEKILQQRFDTAAQKISPHINVIELLETIAELIEKKPVQLVKLFQDKEGLHNIVNLMK